MTSILVVDDSKFMAKCLGRGLEGLGYDVVGVGHDGLEGLALYKELRPALVLLDITMPNMDGLECLCEIRKFDSDARVIMLSAVKDEDTVRQCYDDGAADYLQKPIQFNDDADTQRLRTAIETATAAAAGN